jgi:hypothetical protein
LNPVREHASKAATARLADEHLVARFEDNIRRRVAVSHGPEVGPKHLWLDSSSHIRPEYTDIPQIGPPIRKPASAMKEIDQPLGSVVGHDLLAIQFRAEQIDPAGPRASDMNTHPTGVAPDRNSDRPAGVVESQPFH